MIEDLTSTRTIRFGDAHFKVQLLEASRISPNSGCLLNLGEHTKNKTRLHIHTCRFLIIVGCVSDRPTIDNDSDCDALCDVSVISYQGVVPSMLRSDGREPNEGVVLFDATLEAPLV